MRKSDHHFQPSHDKAMKEQPKPILLYIFAAIVWIVFLVYFVPHHYIAS